MSTAQDNLSAHHELPGLVEDKMRKDGFLPPELPKWERKKQPPASLPRPDETCQLVDGVSVTVESPIACSAHDAAFVWVFQCNFASNVDMETRKRLALPLLVDKMERALVVLRTMIRANKPDEEDEPENEEDDSDE